MRSLNIIDISQMQYPFHKKAKTLPSVSSSLTPNRSFLKCMSNYNYIYIIIAAWPNQTKVLHFGAVTRFVRCILYVGLLRSE